MCGWERQAPLTGREPVPLGLAQRLKNDAVPTELLWKLQVSALLQLDLRRHICYDLANLCHPTGGLFTCVCSEGLPGCKAGCPYTVIRGLRLAVTTINKGVIVASEARDFIIKSIQFSW